MKDALSVKFDILPYINGQGLDLGCGDTRPNDWMLGVDARPGTTQRGPNVIADCRPLETIPEGERRLVKATLSIFADGEEDYVFSSHLLQLLAQWPVVLREWWRLVRPDGYLILFLP